MTLCPLPANESSRLKSLEAMQVLDTPAEHYLDTLVELAKSVFEVDTVLISLVDRNRQWFKARAGLNACETPRDISFCGHAILQPGPLIIPDAKADPRFASNPLVVGPPFIHFYAGHPIHAPDGQPIGTLCLLHPHEHEMKGAQVDQLRYFADLGEGYLQMHASSLQNRQLFDALDHERRKGMLDPLTQLWNRSALEAIQNGSSDFLQTGGKHMGVIYVDIDHFKRINDDLGHSGGDEVLVEAARRLRAVSRPDDLVIRQGGEEFVVLLKVQGEDELRNVAERIRTQFETVPFKVAEGERKVTLSAGCALRHDSESLADILKRADDALYLAKNKGRNRTELAGWTLAG